MKVISDCGNFGKNKEYRIRQSPSNPSLHSHLPIPPQGQRHTLAYNLQQFFPSILTHTLHSVSLKLVI